MFEFSKGAVVLLSEEGLKELDIPANTQVWGHVSGFARTLDGELVVRIDCDDNNSYNVFKSWLLTESTDIVINGVTFQGRR